MAERKAQAADLANGGDVHVLPTYGKAHECEAGCWCEPELEYVDADTGRVVWVHRDLN